MDTDAVEVLHQIDIQGGDKRWPIRVLVERRIADMDGTPKKYINLVICAGPKRLFIPRRVSTELAKALEQAAVIASDAYVDLLETRSGTEAESILRRCKK